MHIENALQLVTENVLYLYLDTTRFHFICIDLCIIKQLQDCLSGITLSSLELNSTGLSQSLPMFGYLCRVLHVLFVWTSSQNADSSPALDTHKCCHSRNHQLIQLQIHDLVNMRTVYLYCRHFLLYKIVSDSQNISDGKMTPFSSWNSQFKNYSWTKIILAHISCIVILSLISLFCLHANTVLYYSVYCSRWRPYNRMI